MIGLRWRGGYQIALWVLDFFLILYRVRFRNCSLKHEIKKRVKEFKFRKNNSATRCCFTSWCQTSFGHHYRSITLTPLSKGAVKRATRFATLLQNELNGGVARFTTHVQTCLVTNEENAGWEKLLQKVESSSTFCNRICKFCAFYRPKANMFCSKWRNSRVWHDSRVILSNEKPVFA